MDNIDSLIDEISKNVQSKMKEERWGEEVYDEIILNTFAEQSKKIILHFLEDNYDLPTLQKTQKFLSTFPDISIIDSEKIPQYCCAFFNNIHRKIFVSKKYFLKYRNSINLIKTILHEYAHAFSYLLSHKPNNCILEEAFAEIFVEICLSSYLKKNKKIECISEQDQNSLIKSLSTTTTSYGEPIELLKSFLLILKNQNKDMAAIKEYFFGSKEDFLKICSETIGPDFMNIFNATKNSKIYLKINNAHEFLPEAKEKMLKILIKQFPDALQTQYKKENSEYLYSLQTPFLHYAYNSTKLPYKYFYSVARAFSKGKKAINLFLFSDEDFSIFDDISDWLEDDQNNEYNINEETFSNRIKCTLSKPSNTSTNKTTYTKKSSSQNSKNSRI